MVFDFFANGCVQSQKADRTIELKDIPRLILSWEVGELRRGDKAKKRHIPAICPQGKCDESMMRNLDTMKSNGLAMVDLDKLPMTYEAIKELASNEKRQEQMKKCGTLLAYVTCSGNGMRFIFPLYKDCDIMQSAALYVHNVMPDLMKYLDTSTSDISRLSILTSEKDYFFLGDDADIKPNEINDEDAKLLQEIARKGGVVDYIKELNKEVTEHNANTAEEQEDKAPKNAKEKDPDNVAYKNYTDEMILANDRMYANVRYKGRRVIEIAEAFVSYKTKGMGAEVGERHALYSMLCKNFRNLVDNNPCVLHAVLPTLGHEYHETWRQCYYYTSRNQSTMLPKEFWSWMKGHGFLEQAQDDEEVQSEEDKMYDHFLATMPPLPPILREFVKTAPKWFKLPCIASMQCYTALLCTNHRSYYFDGMPVSTTLYTLVYAPAASGKSYVRKLKTILKATEQRDKLAIEKAKWYDRQQRQNNGSGKLPDEIVWKQRLFASKTSLGEILKRQEAIGEHHWLQDVGEFSIWAATIKKNKEEWSAFFRTSYDNEEFSQSYQSANAYRGKVAVFPIVHGTCTVGQIKSFFTNVEDGLLTRFSFIPLLHQRFASYQAWKIMSDKDQARIDKVLERLEFETYADVENKPEEVDEEMKGQEVVKNPKKKEGDNNDWDYEFKSPIFHDLSYVHDALLAWLEEKRRDAQKDANDALDTFRRRCAHNAFIYAIICRALWGKNDKATRDLIVRNALWDAEVKLYYMRYMWEEPVNDELAAGQKTSKGIRQKPVFDILPETFTRSTVENALMANGYKTSLRLVLSCWKNGGIIEQVGKNTYKKKK